MSIDRLSWDGWAHLSDAAPVTDAGRAAISWAVGVLRGVFGESWLADNAAASGHIPLFSVGRWPLSNPRTIMRLWELAARAAVVQHHGDAASLLADAARVHPEASKAAQEFAHLCLTMEVAAFAADRGWDVTYERPLPSGRRPDLWLHRNGLDVVVEVTSLGFDRNFLAVDAWSRHLSEGFLAMEFRHGVELVAEASTMLDEAATASWRADVDEAARCTSADGHPRVVACEGNRVEIVAAGERPAGTIARWPQVTGDLWRRVATRLESKIRQTRGGPPTWLRLDDVGTLFRLTDRGTGPLDTILDALLHNITVALNDAPHIRGVIVGDGETIATSATVNENVWPGWDPGPGPARHRLATGPVALRRVLPGGRLRSTFVLPSPRPQVQLPAGTGLEPGLWYADEPTWLDRTLRNLGRPPLASLLTS